MLCVFLFEMICLYTIKDYKKALSSMFAKYILRRFLILDYYIESVVVDAIRKNRKKLLKKRGKRMFSSFVFLLRVCFKIYNRRCHQR